VNKPKQLTLQRLQAEHDRLKDLVRQLLDTHAYEATTTAQNTLIVQIRSIVGRTTK